MAKPASKAKKRPGGQAARAAKPKAKPKPKRAASSGAEKWNTREITVFFRGQTLKGKIGIAVPGLDAPTYEKYLELASLCAQHAARNQGTLGV